MNHGQGFHLSRRDAFTRFVLTHKLPSGMLVLSFILVTTPIVIGEGLEQVFPSVWCALLSIKLLREAAVLTAAGDGVEWPADLDTVIQLDKQ